MAQKCPACGEAVLRRETRKVAYTYKGMTVEVDQPGQWCSACGEAVLSAEDLVATRKPLHDARARADGLLLSDEVRRIRKRLGLTQRQAAALFGGGTNAFSRYERGEVMQPRALDQLLRLLDDHPELLEEIRGDKAA